MPRSFDVSADYEGSVEELHRAFSAPEYWRDRMADTPVDIATLETMRIGGESGADGTVEVVTVQTVCRHHLPGLVTQLHGGDLSIRRAEVWGPITDGVATASISGAIVGAPVNLWGTAELAPIAESGGTRQTFHVTIHVRAPIIGRKIEKIMGNHLSELVSWEHRFTTDWITNNA
jgi:hypothetical protein